MPGLLAIDARSEKFDVILTCLVSLVDIAELAETYVTILEKEVQERIRLL
jgi:hypothetical protein